jgi:hypothetical protein
MDLTLEALQFLLNTGRAQGGVNGNVGLLPYAVLPSGNGQFGIVPVEESLYAQPVSIKKRVAVYDDASFVAYFLAYANQSSRIFVDLKGRLITAVLDYHESGNLGPLRISDTKGAASTPVPRWCTHILKHEFRHTRKWEAWTANNTAVGAKAPATFGQFTERIFLEQSWEEE